MSDQFDLFAPAAPSPAAGPGQGPTRTLPHYLTALHALADAARLHRAALPSELADTLRRLDNMPASWGYEALPLEPTDLMVTAGDHARLCGKSSSLDIWRAMVRAELAQRPHA